MKQSEKDDSRKSQSGRASTWMEGTPSGSCEAASTGRVVVVVGSPQGLLSTRPRDTTLVAKTDTSTPGISGVGFSAGLPVLFLYVNSSVVSSSLKVGIQRS